MAPDPGSANTPPHGPRHLPVGTRVERRAFSDLGGWDADDHLAAFQHFASHCHAVLTGAIPLRAGLDRPEPLARLCGELPHLSIRTRAEARAFFEARFTPYEILPATGSPFLTGYYEPEVEASLVRTDAFRAPLLARPADLEPIPPGETRPGIPEGFAAARRLPDGRFEPLPARGAILDGALGQSVQPILWLRDEVEVFFLQVQGSGRARLTDGSVRRIAYSGRNGHPYTMIGRVMVQEGLLSLEQAKLEPMKAWLRAHPAEADRLMRLNRSYVFFRIADELAADAGPIGGAGRPLTAWRSIAIDRTLWAYGQPIWIESDLPGTEGTTRFAALTLAEDTGAAILGAARADLFHGSGFEAGVRASQLRHPMRFIVLWANP